VAFAVLPDMEQELVTWLKAQTAVTTQTTAARIATELNTATTAGPALQVTSLGGTQPWPWEAVVEFQLSAWGGTKPQANLLARTVAAAVYDLVGQAVTGGHVTGVDIRLAPLWAPDEDTNRPRYRVDAAFIVHPA
jgi:hypothetical protein